MTTTTGRATPAQNIGAATEQHRGEGANPVAGEVLEDPAWLPG
jgi:hypothetical protein